MAFNYRLVQPSGKDSISIAMTDTAMPGDTQNIGVKSPEWMVKIDDLLSSSVADYTDHAELYGWHGKSSRFTTGDIGNLLLTSASLRHSDVVIIIPNGAYAPVLENKMNMGNKLDEILLVRLGNSEAVKVKLQTISFATCRFQSFQQELDRLYLTFNVTKKVNTVFAYDETGANTGQTVSTVDYSQHTVE